MFHSLSTHNLPSLALSPPPEMTQNEFFSTSQASTQAARVESRSLSEPASLRDRRFNKIITAERMDFDFMNTPAIEKGEKRCFVILTSFVILTLIALIVLLSIYARKMDTGTLTGSIITCSGYVLWGVFLCYNKYETCKKYYGGIF